MEDSKKIWVVLSRSRGRSDACGTMGTVCSDKASVVRGEYDWLISYAACAPSSRIFPNIFKEIAAGYSQKMKTKKLTLLLLRYAFMLRKIFPGRLECVIRISRM